MLAALQEQTRQEILQGKKNEMKNRNATLRHAQLWKKRKSGASRVRTGDPLLAKQMRYQLRYSPVQYSEQTNQICKVGPGGLEPPTSSLSGMRSNHLSYGPAVFVTQVNILHPMINTSNGVSGIDLPQIPHARPNVTGILITDLLMMGFSKTTPETTAQTTAATRRASVLE